MKTNQIKVLVAPNSMKGSLSAFDFADAVEEALLMVSDRFMVKKVPVADGGDFTGEVMRCALKARPVRAKVKDPLGRTIPSKYFVAGKTAIIEMSDASGLKLMTEEELNPMEASSFGTGELIAAAVKKGCTEILLAVGGSATVDGGAGMMQALGYNLYDEKGNSVVGNGENLVTIASIGKPKFPGGIKFKIISDVDNSLLGSKGAAAVFAPQKGAGPEQVRQLEQGLQSWCQLLEKDSGKELAAMKGAGAAGGIALPLIALLNAEIVQGAPYILSLLNFEEQVQWADLVITGEGKIDRQTLSNKAPRAVADLSQKAGKPVVAIAGTVEPGATELFDGGAYSFLSSPLSLQEAMHKAKEHLVFFVSELAKTLLLTDKK